MKKTIAPIAFHHFGLACKDFTNALRFYVSLGYDCTPPVVDPLQNVELIYCSSEDLPDVELIRQIDETSPVANFLKSANEMLYHLCYEADLAEQGLEELFPDQRIVCVSKPKPAVLFDNRLVSFYYINGVGLTEILHR